jgi:CubicO group peptidase (beta-lactamase class C family)
MQQSKVPGVSVAVVYKDQVVFLKGYGVRKVGHDAEVNPDTVFEIASFSKPIASTIVASVVGTGEVDWDSRIEDLDPQFKLSNPTTTEQLTVRDLFAHRSGLPTESGDLLEDLGYTRPDILHQIRFLPLAADLRKAYQYSNFGLTEGAVAVTKKVGMTWEELAEQRLYSKIGMRSTSSQFSDYENNPNKAALHVLEDGIYRNRYVREADAESPAGGVSSSARDLAQWLRLQLGKGSWNGQQVVAEKPLLETRNAQICRSVKVLPPGDDCPGNQFYGLGWNVDTDSQGRERLSHSGAFLLGSGTSIYMVPSEQIGILVLGNSTPIGLPEAICLSFLDFFHYGAAKLDYLTELEKIFKQLRDAAQNASPNYSEIKPPPNPSPAKPLSSYVGKYSSKYYGMLEVELENQQLILRLPPRGAYYELKHWDGDTFTYYFASESSGVARRGVKFSPNRVLIENLATEGDGIFRRIESE